jgi:hypothetical protein
MRPHIGQPWKPRPSSSLGLVAVLTFLALLGSAALALDIWIIGLAMSGAFLWLIAFPWMVRANPNLRDSFFWLLLILLLTIGFIQKRTGISVGIVLEGTLLLASPFTIWTIRSLDEKLKRLLILLACFLFFSMMSAAFGQGRVIATVFQIATDMKFPLLLLLGFYVAWTDTTERRFWSLVRWLWLPLAALVVVQWAAPSIYFGYIHTTFSGQEDPFGLLPSRALGPFNHAATLAAVASLLFLIAYIRGVLKDRTFLIPAVAYFAILLGTSERIEIVSLLVVFVVLYTVLNRDHGIPFVLVAIGTLAIVVLVTATLGSTAEDRLLQVHEVREFIGDARPFRPRPVYFFTSFSIANQAFPLGSGPGTFAGAGAGKFNWDLYQKLGFFGYSWFSPMYLFETYWPHFIAETGWFGFLSYFCFVLGLIWYATRESFAAPDSTLRMYWLVAASGLGYLFMTSLNGPTFEDPTTAFLATVFFGIAYQLSRRPRSPYFQDEQR